MKKRQFSVKNDFSEFPGPRFKKIGDWSGELFRDDYLIPLIKSLDDDEILVINLDGTKGLGSSFLDESFGGAVRKGYGSYVPRLEFISTSDPSVIVEIDSYIQAELNRSQKKSK